MSNWFPTSKNGNEEGWRFDIVSLLAVIGENSIESHSQALTSSWTCMLPRIIPAPQVLLKPTRPNRMPHVNATIVGVHNGVMVPTLNYFPNIIHPIDDLPPFSFKVLNITHKTSSESTEPDRPQSRWKSTTKTTSVVLRELESGVGAPPRRRPTFKHVKEKLVPTSPAKKPPVPPQTYSPLTVLTWFSFFITLALFILAAYLNDGTACVAIGTISLVSSIVGYASWWQPRLMNRTFDSKVPPGDVMIRTREGAFLLVICDEKVARELYFGTEECRYRVKTQFYRVLVGLGTFLLMISVVLLGNCDFNMQAAIASSYISLNGAFWAISLIKKGYFWDLSAYICEDITPEDCNKAHIAPPRAQQVSNEEKPSFTRTMWYAIRETRKIGWVKRSGAAPETPQWDQWLREAEIQSSSSPPNREWRAVQRREEIVGGVNTAPEARHDGEDTAMQHAPAIDVPPADMQGTKGI